MNEGDEIIDSNRRVILIDLTFNALGLVRVFQTEKSAG
jgi:hypothetical protein